MNPIEQFVSERQDRIQQQGADDDFKALSLEWTKQSMDRNYVYNFEWMGRPIIQFPQDILLLQEVIWSVKPDLIIETGIAHGGSLIFSASMLELLGGDGEVVGVDIDIRQHNREQIENHSMYKRINLIEGSSIDQKIVSQVKTFCKGKKKIMVILDSMHSHNHVYQELIEYGPLVSIDSYMVVLDTFIEDLPEGYFHDRPWDVGDNPKTAVYKYLKENSAFEIDESFQNKSMVTVAPDGFLKRKA